MAVNTTSHAQFGTPDRKHARSRSADGRECRQAECSTVLSRYNADEYCYLHIIPAFTHPPRRT